MLRTRYLPLIVAAVLSLVLMAGPIQARQGNMGQCLSDCPPGVNDCSNCCEARFEKVAGGCYPKCNSDFDGALQKCRDDLHSCLEKGTDSGNCFTQKRQCDNTCRNNFMNCRNNCSGIPFDIACPGSVPPQKCPYDCMSWNPASKSCIGPHMNGCQ